MNRCCSIDGGTAASIMMAMNQLGGGAPLPAGPCTITVLNFGNTNYN
jgi:hypothetical protein